MVARPMFAPMVPETSVLFVSQSSIESGAIATYGLKKRVEAVRECRSVGKKDMKYNNAMPAMKVDPESYTVVANGEACTAAPAEALPLTQAWYVY